MLVEVPTVALRDTRATPIRSLALYDIQAAIGAIVPADIDHDYHMANEFVQPAVCVVSANRRAHEQVSGTIRRLGDREELLRAVGVTQRGIRVDVPLDVVGRDT